MAHKVPHNLKTNLQKKLSLMLCNENSKRLKFKSEEIFT